MTPTSAASPSSPARDESAEPVIVLRRPVRRQRRGANPQIVSLWLLFGAFAAAALVWVAIKANVDRGQQPIAGAREDQQKQADALRAALARDSTDVRAHIELGDILFDTGNWGDAIIHYRSAVRRDSSLTNAIVDLGVCYYNLSASEEAERLFLLALQREPHQPVALFNLGIVNEQRKEYPKALEYFHRAVQSNPPESMRKPLVDAIDRLQKATGKAAPPLPPG